MKASQHENEKTNGNAELPLTAEEREKRKLASYCQGLNVYLASGEQQKQTDLQEEQPENDVIRELPTPLHLIIQRYEGGTCEGQFHGEGVACFAGGHVYKGMFSMGLMDGHGVFTWEGGMKYEGEFVRNIPMGQGTYTWTDGSSYKGEVHSGVRHGTGTHKCVKNNVSYKGQWDQGKRHGKGAVYYNQDRSSWYKGDWVNNNREGWGVRRYPSGNMYSGEWKANLRHGEGTMRWKKLGQQYVGTWQDGVQHGRGTHTWILRRADGSQYTQSNQYTGDFVQGQRHGQGTFYYANGGVYEGEWRKNKKHGKGKFTFEDGHIFEGEFVDDQMMAHPLNGNKALPPLPGSSLLGPDMALNIECLLQKIPERKRDTERKQVECVVLRLDSDLRSIYSFYSRLGHAHSPDNTFLLSRLQLWRLLRDCNIHHQGLTLTQIDHLIKEDSPAAEIHSPFTPMLLRQLLSCLVVVAYHIYHEEMVSQKHLLAACFSKLMTDNILPNAKNIKGFLFRQPQCAVVAVKYLMKCWEIYQAHCKVNAGPTEDQTMTCRHLLWMFKDLHLLDNNLTTAKLMQIITAESQDPSNPSSCLDLEITFLEFFEVLLGCVEVKCQQVTEGLKESSDGEARRDLPEVETKENVAAPVNPSIPPEASTPKSVETIKRAESSPAQYVDSQQDVKSKSYQSAEHAGEQRGEGKDAETSRMKTKDREVEHRNQTIHQFFNHFYFPAFEHHQIVSGIMKEERLRQEAQRRIALAKAQQRAREKRL